MTKNNEQSEYDVIISGAGPVGLDRRGLLKDLELHKRLKNPHSAPASGEGPLPPRQAGHFAGIPFHEINIDTSQWKYRFA